MKTASSSTFLSCSTQITCSTPHFQKILPTTQEWHAATKTILRLGTILIYLTRLQIFSALRSLPSPSLPSKRRKLSSIFLYYEEKLTLDLYFYYSIPWQEMWSNFGCFLSIQSKFSSVATIPRNFAALPVDFIDVFIALASRMKSNGSKAFWLVG